MKFKLDSKSILAIVFVFILLLGGILTLALSPVEVLGGLVRGYISAPEGSNVLQKIGNSFKVFDSRMSEYFAFHDASIHAYGCTQRLVGRTLIDDVDSSSEVVKLKNGYLTFKSTDNTDLTSLKDYLVDVKSTSNSEVLYIRSYSKTTSLPELIPSFYPYHPTSNFNEIKEIMVANDISVIDFDEITEQQQFDKYSLFFKTDHHWTPQAGLWASQNICAKINESYGWDLDTSIYDISDYDIHHYSGAFLGSQGKRVGALYAGVDNFDVIIPKFETNLTVEMEDIDFNVTGNFAQTLIDETHITPENLLNKNTTAYMTYMQGNHPLVKITNHGITNGKTALFIMDSYGCVVAPYLSLAFQQLDCIDIRSYSGSVEEYINTTDPDIVIYAISNHQ